ncbi:MAG TPA: MoxR family ATPase [Gemmatimonadales bacterium]|jgi:MoxR-like ATPase|nr:MoxR family ATPase [Gemmatimonadales bacterium]
MSALPRTETEVEALLGRLAGLRAEIARVIVGQDRAVGELLIAFLAGGHALLEGVPGLAKTLLIRTLAQAADVRFRRIQFTPDLMPTDIIGTEILEEDHATGRRFFKFHQGPVFANIVLADEINRTPPKTQAALLEAMQEHEVTYGGTTYPLDPPFFVLATQNPIEQSGTYPLPEAQLDRFLLYIRIGYPSEAEEQQVLARTTGRMLPDVSPVVTAADILAAQALVREVRISEDLMRWVTRLVRATRPTDSDSATVREWVRWGAGPRAGQALILGAKARAVLQGRFAVTLPDLRAVAQPVLRHRVLLNYRAEAEGISTDDITDRLLAEVPAPASPLA